MLYSQVREQNQKPSNLKDTGNNLFLKKSTLREGQNINEFPNNMSGAYSPIKVTSQMVMNPNLIREDNQKPSYNESYPYNRTENNKITNNNYSKNYYREEPSSQSFNVEEERKNRLLKERQRDYENPQNAEPNTDYYYKSSRTSSDINDYNNRYTYNHRRDFDFIDFNKISQSQQLDFNKKNLMMDINNNLKYRTQKENNLSRFEKPFEGPTPASRQRSVDFQYRKKGNDMEPFYRYKNVEYYGQRDPDTFGYDQIDDKYRYYSPFRNDYDGSRYGSYTYNYYLNAPMRGDISEDFKYPPQYYYRPKQEEIKQGKVFTNLF